MMHIYKIFNKNILKFLNKIVFLAYVTPRLLMSAYTNFSQFRPAVWPARGI